MEQSVVRNKAGLVVAMLFAVQLGACSSVPDAVNPISWYRGITGASKNDDLGKGQNQQNLNEGSNEPYPNLASVPNPPDTAMSTVDRAKLADSLIADRKDARYADNQLHAGEVSASAPPPPAAAAPPAPKSEAAAAAPSPAPREAAAPSPAPAKSAPPGASPAASAKPARGTESPPAESSLASPSIKNPPQGETPMPAPPPPSLSATAAPRTPPMKEAEAAPAPPPAAAAEPMAVKEAPAPRKTAASHRVAVIGFAPGSALLSDKERSAIANLAKQQKAQGGRIRIVGHGESEGANAAVTGFNLALDRAQAVSIALTEAGVAAKDVAVEAAPVAAKGGRDVPRAEIYLER
jgi:outer membrane protein OmpA-like peptidoglycan-associated protein